MIILYTPKPRKLINFLKSLDIDHTVKYTSRNGRPMALAGTPILELL